MSETRSDHFILTDLAELVAGDADAFPEGSVEVLERASAMAESMLDLHRWMFSEHYGLDQYGDRLTGEDREHYVHEWNGGDVCEVVADKLNKLLKGNPDARFTRPNGEEV